MTTKISFKSFHDANFYSQGNSSTTLHVKKARFAQFQIAQKGSALHFLTVVENSKDSKVFQIYIGLVEKKLQADSSYQFIVTKDGNPFDVAKLKKYCGIAQGCFCQVIESGLKLSGISRKDVLPVIQNFLKTGEVLELDEAEVEAPVKAIVEESVEKPAQVVAESIEPSDDCVNMSILGIAENLGESEVDETEAEIPMPEGFFTSWFDSIAEGFNSLTRSFSNMLSSISSPFKATPSDSKVEETASVEK